MLVALLVALLAALWPSPAQAHARPVSTSPGDGAVLPEAPTALSVTFNEPVALASAGNQLLGPDGSVLEAAYTVRDRVLTITPAEPLGPGTHVVGWRVASADSHPIGGAFSFSVGAASAHAPSLPDLAEDREVRLAQVCAHVVQYAGVLGLAGLIGLITLVAPASARASSTLARRWQRTAALFAGLAGAGAIASAPLAALWESGRPLGSFASPGTWSDAAAEPAGLSALVVTAGAVVALVGVRRRRDAVAVAGATTALGAMVLVGHTRSFGPSWLVLGADLVHLAAAAFWWGGLLGLALALDPGSGLRISGRARLVVRFSTAAAVSVVALVAAGLVLYWRIGHSVSGLWETGYGRALLVKSALVVPVVAMAAWNRRRLVPRLAGGGGERAGTRLRAVVRAEALVLAAVVVATGVLVSLTPPARPPATATASAPAAEQSTSVEVDDGYRATIVLAPGRRGVNGVRVTVTDEDGGVVDPATVPDLTFTQPEAELGPLRRVVSPAGTGRWEGTVDLPISGPWQVSLVLPVSRFQAPVAVARIEVP